MVTRSGAHDRSSAGQPFLLLLGDHLYLSAEPRRCARQLIELAAAENCAVSAVQATREHLIHQYGTLTGRRLPEHPDIYAIDEIIEKPNPTLAELRLHVPGLRAGHYLCFFGMHVLTPIVFDLLDRARPRQRPRAGPDPAHDGPQCPRAKRAVPCTGNPRLPV